MTVAELVLVLMRLPGDLPVCSMDESGDWYTIDEPQVRSGVGGWYDMDEPLPRGQHTTPFVAL